MRKLKRNIRAALLLVAVLALTLLPVAAQGAIDTEKDVTLTVRYWHDKTPVSGVPVSLYRVADVSAYGEYTLCGDFKDYPVRVSDLDSEGWQILAETLTGYVERDKVKPVDSGKTDTRGYLKFPSAGKKMKAGLYLVIAQQYIDGKLVYTTEPFLVALPNPNATSNSWDYDVTVSPKHTRGYLNGGGSDGSGGNGTTVERKVLKRWRGETDKLPASVTVQLLKNGAVYETVTLNEKNNWRYTWSKLPKYDEKGAEIVWRVTENKTTGYTTTSYTEGTTFVVTNTKSDDKTPNAPTKPNGSGGSGSSGGTSGGQLPNTGVLWWPVPVLAVVGIGAILFGCLRGKKKDDA